MNLSQNDLARVDAAAHRWLVRNSLTFLRISVGVIFLAFGVLKYFPGVSPAQNLAEDTTHILTFGLVPGGVAIVVIATLECVIGLILISGRGMRAAIYLLGGEFVGILSPIVLETGRLFAGPHHAPTLEGQYVLKDIILVAAAMVIATSLRGATLVAGENSAKLTEVSPEGDPVRAFGARDKLAIVLAGIRGDRSLSALCREHGIERGDYERWRDETLDGATRQLATAEERST